MTLLNPRRLVVYNTNLSILNIFTGNKTKKLFISKENYSLEKKKKKNQDEENVPYHVFLTKPAAGKCS